MCVHAVGKRARGGVLFFILWRVSGMIRFVLRITVLVSSLALSVPVFAEDGIVNLGPEEIVKAKGADIVVPGYSVPSFEDWNNDSLKDLIIGEGGGTVPGKVRIYLNRGTASDPCFVDSF